MKYDVALSFAGEDREYVEQVAGYLRRAQVKVFYDKYEQVDLWGKNLYEHLSDVYQNQARFTVMFISTHYAEKLWTRHERRAAQERAFRENSEYLLPARFDDTAVPGLLETIGYLDLATYTPANVAEAILEKVVKAGGSVVPLPPPSSSELVTAISQQTVNIRVRGQNGLRIADAAVVLIGRNGTHIQARTDADGFAMFNIDKRRTTTVFCAHPQYAAFLGEDFDPIRDLSITLSSVPDIGSLVILGSWFSIPGLTGEVGPIHDSLNRLYVYTKNIAVDGGRGQPVGFEVGKPLNLEDASGRQIQLTFVAVIADNFLIEYKLHS